ncbi:MAG: hypothetical protein ACRELA_06195, partial [Candidatus Rokuibacteriota bacterium]
MLQTKLVVVEGLPGSGKFANAVRLWGIGNPRFLEGTLVEEGGRGGARRAARRYGPVRNPPRGSTAPGPGCA